VPPLLSYLCNPCTVLCPKKCTRKLFFCCIWQSQAGGGGLCVGHGAGCRHGGDGKQSTILHSHLLTGHSLSSKITHSCLDTRCSHGARQARGPREPAKRDGKILAKICTGYWLAWFSFWYKLVNCPNVCLCSVGLAVE